LSTLNWRPVHEIEQRTRALESEILRVRSENKRLAELNSRLDALLRSPDSSSPTPPAADCN
jgi:uncharacterized small protein (DUF1192 family)